MLNTPYNLITSDSRNKGKVTVDTFVFNTFFMMTMFNQINSRCIDGFEMNVCKTILSNFLFWVIWMAEIGVQVLMLLWCNTSVGSTILGMTPMSFELWVISILIGAFSLVVHIIQIKVPMDQFIALNKKIGLDEDGANEAVDNIYGKIYGKLKHEDEDADDNFVRIKEAPEAEEADDDNYTPIARSRGQP